MQTLARLGAFSLFVFTCALLIGCGGGGGAMPMSQIPPSEGGGFNSDIIRVGDKITIQLSGVPDQGYFVEKQIPPSGDFTLPYLTQSFEAVGKTTSQLAQEVTAAYKGQKIYTNPVVTELEEERFITVGGEVRGPTNVAYRPDLTIVGVINSCGGFTEFANRKSVRVIRGTKVFYVDCLKAVATPGNDPPVYPGDQIYVSRTVF
ncbi:MAG TPA: SLBB domain-containing protein [Candidatus Methylacidiphilales bacterium]|nr:SLBB domain-containing protein [Candidatus Methylacidiphilales bacterium]